MLASQHVHAVFQRMVGQGLRWSQRNAWSIDSLLMHASASQPNSLTVNTHQIEFLGQVEPQSRDRNPIAATCSFSSCVIAVGTALRPALFLPKKRHATAILQVLLRASRSNTENRHIVDQSP